MVARPEENMGNAQLERDLELFVQLSQNISPEVVKAAEKWKGSKNLKQATFWGINQTTTRDSFTLDTQYHTHDVNDMIYTYILSLLVTCRIYHKTLYFSTHLSVYAPSFLIIVS